jgi:hypothetical protein
MCPLSEFEAVYVRVCMCVRVIQVLFSTNITIRILVRNFFLLWAFQAQFAHVEAHQIVIIHSQVVRLQLVSEKGQEVVIRDDNCADHVLE